MATYPEVISSFIYEDSPKWQTYLASLKIDNLGVARRGPISNRIEDNMDRFDRIMKEGTKSLHPGLKGQEASFRRKVKRPKSKFSWKVFLESVQRFERDNREVKWIAHKYHNEYFPCEKFVRHLESEGLTWPFFKSTVTDLNLTGLDLSKGSGQPKGGPKRLQLSSAIAYAEKIISDPHTPAYYVMPGYRTQTERDDGTPKVRLVWGIPISEWVLQQRGFRSSIENTVRYAQDSKQPNILVLYTTPDRALEVMRNYFPDTECIVVFDSTAFDSSLKADEIIDTHTWASPDAPALDHIIDYMLRAPVKLPDGELNKYGGMDSGCVTTNGIGDGANNLRDICFCLEAQNLLYVNFIVVNGDDIAVFFSVVLTAENIEKVSKLSSREINPEKSEKSTDSVFFSKVFYCQEYWCKPVYLVLNSIMFREHEADALTGSKEYTAVVIAQQCEYLRYHPLGDKIVRLIKSLDKYPINTFDKSQIEPALNLYKSKHNWMDETGQMEEMATLQDKGFYAQA